MGQKNSGRRYEYEGERQSAKRSANYSRASVNAGAGKKRRRKKKKSHAGLIAMIIIIIAIAGAAFVAWKTGMFNKQEEAVVEKPLPEYPSVSKTATVGATGDILLHGPVLNACYTGTGDGYDFTNIFAGVKEYYSSVDLMIANLEVTLGGEESGAFTGYPVFNSPDSIVSALKDAGVDLCLTANNHSNDTGYYGMMRTLSVLDDYGIDHLGTRETTDEHYIWTGIVNGIKLGMICYTYDTRDETEWVKSLNGGYLSEDARDKVNTFNYSALDEFYEDVEQQLYYMRMLGCEANIFFLHWGNEYEDYPNDIQTQIAEKLCELGVDVIIGGHPHVVQEFDTYESSTGHQMICLYSMGNELSNQRRYYMEAEDDARGYTEDGLIIQLSIEKFNNGKVKIGGVSIIPTWVEEDTYEIIALDTSKDTSEWNTWYTDSAIGSYNRTLGRLSSAYNEYRVSKNLAAVPDSIE